MKAPMQITMKLMQNRAKDNGANGAHDITRWPVHCKAVDFLAKIQVARSYDELLDVSSPLHRLCYALILPDAPYRRGGVSILLY
jgi:hypothetical protein